jgi:hypothetical protein
LGEVKAFTQVRFLGCCVQGLLHRVVHLVHQVKISVGAVEVLRKKERQDETQFTTKIDDFF